MLGGAEPGREMAFPHPRVLSVRERQRTENSAQAAAVTVTAGRAAGDCSVPDRDPLIFSLIPLVYPLEPGSGTAHWEAEERKRPIWKAREEEEGERQRETQPTLCLPPASF